VSQILKYVAVPYVTNEQCKEVYGSGITDTMLCAGGKPAGGEDSCQGDFNQLTLKPVYINNPKINNMYVSR
jgi:hypothetical protein